MGASAPPEAGSSEATMLAKPGALGRASTEAGDLRCPTCDALHPSSFRVCPADGTPLRAGAITAEDPLIGAVLAGTFRVIGQLGEGGMGLVYEAEHLRLDRRYAVKVIHRGFADREDLVARFDREARAMSRVCSDHVVDVIDLVRTADGRQAIVAEKLEGEDLDAHLSSRGKLPLRTALPLFRQICRGLAAAHAHGIVHRDLKPANLFLADDPAGGVTLKILDFGVAKLGGDAELTGTGTIVGTPAYMAPEQARGSANVDARSDVYSAGAVLYRMLTGHAPYGSGDASATLVRLLEESPARPRKLEKSIPEGLEAVIERAMAREPDDRFATIAELEQAVAAFDPRGGGGSIVLDADPSAGVETLAGDGTRELTRRARLVRPLAVLATVGAALGAGLSVGICLALLVDGLRAGAHIHTPELVLVALGAVVACAATIASGARALRAGWRSAPVVEQIGARAARALAVGLLAFGAIEVGARVWAVLVLRHPGAWDPLWAASRVLLALGIALIATALGRRRS